jgi:hypothetical protein
MQHTLFSLICLLFTFSVLLESCHIRSSASRSDVSIPSATVKTKPSSTMPIQVSSVPCYITYDRPEGLETVADTIVVGKPQASIEDSKPISIPESQRFTKKPIINESVVVKDTEGGNVETYTITSVKIHKLVKGKFKEQEIKVLQPAVVMKESNRPPFISTTKGYSLLKPNSKYLLFLQEIDTKTFPNMARVYSILSINQGKFNFDNTDTEETSIEANDEQYADLKAKVKKKYGAMVNALP